LGRGAITSLAATLEPVTLLAKVSVEIKVKVEVHARLAEQGLDGALAEHADPR
jgi:hypothetical protein